MPRRLDRLRSKTLTQDRLASRGKYQIHRLGAFIDPFPHVHGTLPEKMVYAELSNRNIAFYFINDVRFQIPEIDFDRNYKPDFTIPSLRIIIEVQGSYWHSMEKTIEADSYKFAIYEATGWKVLAWWDFDIYNNLGALFDSEPLLRRASNASSTLRSSELKGTRTDFNDSKGIITLNKKRAQINAWKKKTKYKKSTKRANIRTYEVR